MEKIVTNKALLSRVLTGVSVVTLVFALNVSGALAGFWRTLDGITVNGVTNPTAYLYGFGTSDIYGFGVYGYGYGFGYGTMAAGYAYAPASSGGSSSGGGGSSSGGGTGGAGLPIYDAETGETTETIDTPEVDTDETDTDEPTSSYTPRTYEDQPKIPTCGQSIVNFSDIAGTTFEDYIIALEKISGLNGNGSGTDFNYGEPESKSFQPERSTTRAEYVKMVLRALCIDYSAENTTFDNFSDSSEEWQAKVVNKAVELGLVTTSNATFRPNDVITRGEALKMVMQAAGAPTSDVTSSSFTDVDASSWVARYTEAAKSYGIINGQMINGNLMFRPSDSIKRGESTKLIMKSLFN